MSNTDFEDAQGNVVDFMMEGAKARRQNSVSGSMQEAFDEEADPAKAAEAIDLSEATGAPPATVHQNLDEFKKNYKAQLMGQLIKNNPDLQTYANSHPLAPKISANDWPNLDEWSEKLKALPKGTAAVDKAWWESVGGIASHWFSNLGESVEESTAVPGLVQIGKDITKFESPSAEFKNAVEKLNSEGTNQDTIGGVLNAVNNLPFKGATYSPIFGSNVGAQEFVGAIFTDIGIITGVIPTIKTGAEIFDELGGIKKELSEPAAMLAMMLLGLRGGGKAHSRAGELPPPGLDKEVDAIREHRSREDLKAVNDATSAAQKSETTQIAPSLAEKFVAQHVKGQSVQVNVDAIRKLYGDKTPSPDDGLLGWVPGLAEQIDAQSLVGGDVRIPMELWQTRIDPEIAKALKDDMKVTEDGISVNEAQQRKENQEALKPQETDLAQTDEFKSPWGYADYDVTPEQHISNLKTRIGQMSRDQTEFNKRYPGEAHADRAKLAAFRKELKDLQQRQLKPEETSLAGGPDLTRRGFLKGTAATIASAAMKGVPEIGEAIKKPLEITDAEHMATEYYRFFDIASNTHLRMKGLEPDATKLKELQDIVHEELMKTAEHTAGTDSGKIFEEAAKLIKSGWVPTKEHIDAVNKMIDEQSQRAEPEPSEMTKKMVEEGIPPEEAQDLASLPWPEEYMKAGLPKGLSEPGPRNALRQHDEALASVRQGAGLTHLVATEPIKLDLLNKAKDISVSGTGEVTHTFSVTRGDEKLGGVEVIPQKDGKLLYIDWAGSAKTHAPWQEGNNTLPILYQVGRELRKFFPDAERIGGIRGDKYVEYPLDDLGPASLITGSRPKGWEYVEGKERQPALKLGKSEHISAISVDKERRYETKSVGTVSMKEAFKQLDYAKDVRGSLGDALRYIADAVTEKAGDVPIHIIKDAEFDHIIKEHPQVKRQAVAAENVGGFYDPNTHIIIFAERHLRDRYFKQNVLHESIHAATVRGILFDDKLKTNIEKILDHVKSTVGEEKVYGLTNAREFLAELANPKFQKLLLDTKIPDELAKQLGPVRGKFASAWDMVINSIAQFLGLKGDTQVTALEAALRVTQQTVDRRFSIEERRDMIRMQRMMEAMPTLEKLEETNLAVSSTKQIEMVRSLSRLEDNLVKQGDATREDVREAILSHAAGYTDDPKTAPKDSYGDPLTLTQTDVDILARLDKDDLKNYIEYIKNVDPEFNRSLRDYIDTHKKAIEGQLSPDPFKKVYDAIDEMKSVAGPIESPPIAPEESSLASTPRQPELPQAGTTRMEDRKAFKTPAASGMTRDFYEKFQKLIAQQRTEDGKRRMELILRKAQETQTKEWKDNFDRIYKEVEDSVRQNPDFLADAALRRGHLEEPEENAPKTSRRRDRLDSDKLTEEQKAILDPSEHASGAMNPDDFAAALGFNSGDGMLERLSALRQFLKDNNLKPDQLVKNIALEETERRMQAEHGDLGNKILEEARDAAMSESQYDLLHEETLSLATSAGLEFSLTRQQVKEMVKQKFDTIPQGQVSEAGYLRLAGKHGEAVQKALLDGDYMQAFRSKQAQYFAMEMARLAKALKKANDSLSKNFKRFAKRSVSGIDQEYTNVIHDIMFRTDSTPKPRRTPEDLLDAFNRSTHRIGTTEPLRNFVKHRTEAFRELAVPDWLQDPSFKVDDYKKLTTKQVMELKDAMTSLVKNGREERQVEVNGQKHDVLDVLQYMRDQVENLPTQEVKDKVNETRYAKWAKSIGWRHVNIESQADRLDRGKIKGAFKQFVTRPITESVNTKDAMLKKYQEKLNEIGKIPDMDKKVENNLLIDSRTGLPYEMRKRNVIQILNIYGDLGARKKFLKGHDIEEPELAEFLRRNTKPEDWDRAKRIGDIFDDLFEQASVMQHKLSGVAPVKTPRGTFVDPHGKSRESWYSPIRYSRERPGESKNLMGRSAIEEEGYTRATVPTGYLEERTGYSAEFDLNLDMIPIRMRQMIHDISMREAVIQAEKFIQHPEFSRIVRRAIGDKAFEEWTPWLRDVANSPNYMSMAEKAGREAWEHVRQNTISMLIGLNPGTVMKHGLTALANSVIQTGGMAFAKQFGTLIRELPTDRADWNMAKEKSEEIQRRFRNFREIMQGHGSELKLRGGEGTFDTLRELMMNFGAAPVAVSDLLSAVPTWLVKYKEALARGETEGQAIYEGDLALRQTHGSSVISNKPSIMREGGMAATFTSLYGFFSHMLQRQYEMAWRAKDAKIDLGSGKVAAGSKQIKVLAGLLVGYVVLPALIEEAVSPYPNSEKDSWGKWAGKTALYGASSSLIGVRDIGHAVSSGRSAQIGLIPSMVETAQESLKDIAQLRMLSRNPAIAAKAYNHTIATIGLLTGLTFKSEANIAEFLYRWGHGLEHPKGFGDLFSGLRHGTARKRK